MAKKVFVLGIDGMPFTLLHTEYFCRLMPRFTAICKTFGVHKMNSVLPVISSVAWTSFATGQNPGKHGIFGFTDRNSSPFEITIPTSASRKCPAVWNQLPGSKRSIVINVPLTYPPEQINGLMVSCFLCPDIKKSTFPRDFYKHLVNMDYIIDADAQLVATDKKAFLLQLLTATEKRFELAHELLETDWSYFQLHIMETDRLMHFFYQYLSKPGSDEYSQMIALYFKQLDSHIYRLFTRIRENTALIILSDHGFCEIVSEFQLNVWLEHNGLLKFNGSGRTLNNYSPDSVCYALTPGRIYINLEGREEKGSVAARDYNAVREQIKKQLLSIPDTTNGKPIADKVFYREEIYQGDYLDDAPDLIVHPKNGYDLKSLLDGGNIFTRSLLTGMHTYEDALIVGAGIDVSKVKAIDQVSGIIQEYFNDESE